MHKRCDSPEDRPGLGERTVSRERGKYVRPDGAHNPYWLDDLMRMYGAFDGIREEIERDLNDRER